MIGGTNWLPMVEYHGLIHRGVAARLGGRRAARLVLRTVEFDEGDGELAPGAWRAAGERIVHTATALEHDGVEAVVLCSTRMHAFAPLVEAALGVPLLHVATATAAALRAAGIRHALVLTAGRSAAETFRDGLRAAYSRLTVSVPDSAERELVRLLLDARDADDRGPSSRDAIGHVVFRWARAGAEAVVLVSDELEPLIERADVPLPLFDATALHADAAVSFALGGAPA